jgi:integrase
MNALIVAYYASADFKSLRPSTARVYRNILERFRKDYGDHDAAGMKAHNVRDLMAKKAAMPGAANRLLGLLSILMEHAIAAGWREDNPAFGVKRLRHRQAGFATWAEPDIASFRDHYPLGTRERLVLELALGTAQRRGDLVRLGWRHVVNGAIVVKQNNTGVTVTVPIVGELCAALDLCPRDRLTFIAATGGRPLGAASLGNEFRDWLRTGPGFLTTYPFMGCARRRPAGWPRLAARRTRSPPSPATRRFPRSSGIVGTPRRRGSPCPGWGRWSRCLERRNIRETFLSNQIQGLTKATRKSLKNKGSKRRMVGAAGFEPAT